MSSSKRTQLFMDVDAYRRLQELARQRESSVGFLVREAVAQYLMRLEPEELLERDPLWKLMDAAAPDGPVDGAAEHDHYLYEKTRGPVAPGRSRKGLRR